MPGLDPGIHLKMKGRASARLFFCERRIKQA
jgi:hypothetical protein